MYPGSAGLSHVDPLDSSLGFREIWEVDTLLLDLHAAKMMDILVGQHANLGLDGHLGHTVYLL